ncbi:hypothetical protein BSL82_00230 [Tardibacter chloracetimidivorans]|uniref:DUF481 domain-containing protein n=1 Tax=Tardibacter chloracetimidivorans TaxID=1921510 RepID=A0A1L3ZQL3_9SPHN|nr:DUF481 domain-containing protein [Tardibacter chloracetimidivorans]API57919.1 hypothetical protein BSL82_00230 [Tardibacter chloracetimidivorans]
MTILTKSLCAALLAVTFSGAAGAEPLPADAQRMLDAAILSGKPERIDAVAAVARETYPESVEEVDAQIAGYRGEKEKMRLAELRTERFWQGWSGQGELGASTSSGNSESVGVTAGLQLSKEDINWQHKFNALVDYRRANGVTEKEHFNTAYQGQRKISRTLYVYGLLQYERDRPAGYYRRFSEGLGLGVRLLDRPGLRLDMDGGPAFRQTAFIASGEEKELSGRASMAFRWDITPRLGFSQDASAFLADNSSFVSTSAMTTKLFGALSSRLSFDVRHETEPPAGSVKTDTVSRVTLLYSF